MIRTYIYGVPSGFDFYEKDVSVNNYFKGFYISSRRGRRLVVNRRNNGETIYSYLRYGLREVKRQPLNAFFGMSLVIDNNQYCPNFKRLLDWFDYLFDKILSEKQIFCIADDNAVQYRISKFEESSVAVNWIKSNLPNIILKDGLTEIVEYDNSFVEGKTGQIVNFNKPVTEERIIKEFKDYCWISINSDIADAEGGDPEVELDYGELNDTLNEFNQLLLPMAIDSGKISPEILGKIKQQVAEILEKLSVYLTSIDGTEEHGNFMELENKFRSLVDNVDSLLLKIPKEPPTPKTKSCIVCKQEKPLYEFNSPASDKCKECEATEKKVCIVCGKPKMLSEFKNPQRTICIDCWRKQNERRQKYFYINIAFALGFAAIILLVVILIPKGCKQEGHEMQQGYALSETKENTESVSGNIVDNALFHQYLDNGNFNGACQCINQKDNADEYKPELESAVFNRMWYIIETTGESKEEKQNALFSFRISNRSALDYIGFTDTDLEHWKNVIITDYMEMIRILKASEITDNDYKKALEICNKYPDRYDSSLQEKLRTKIQETQPMPSKATPANITVSYTDSEGTRKTESVTRSREIRIKSGSFVDVQFPGGIIEVKDQVGGKVISKKKNSLKVGSEEGRIIYCGNIAITIRIIGFKTI